MRCVGCVGNAIHDTLAVTGHCSLHFLVGYGKKKGGGLTAPRMCTHPPLLSDPIVIMYTYGFCSPQSLRGLF